MSWIPFGAGPRTCLGAQFALIEGRLVLATLLRRARFEPTVDEVPDPGVTLRTRHGLPMRVRLR
jgi:cytochrome P450